MERALTRHAIDTYFISLETKEAEKSLKSLKLYFSQLLKLYKIILYYSEVDNEATSSQSASQQSQYSYQLETDTPGDEIDILEPTVRK